MRASGAATAPSGSGGVAPGSPWTPPTSRAAPAGSPPRRSSAAGRPPPTAASRPLPSATGGLLRRARPRARAPARPLLLPPRRLLDGVEDLEVAGAAAEDARERVADAVAAGRRIGVEQRLRG